MNGPPAADGDAPRFERLSALAMELSGFREHADGGGSSLFSDDEDGGGKPAHANKPRRSHPVDDESYDEDDEGAPSVLAPSEMEGDDGVEAPRGGARKKKMRKAQPSAASGDAAMIANAAFGGGGVYAGSDDESNSGLSTVSSKARREAHRAAFPIKGVDCVGCALAHKIVPVERFVIDNMARMSDDALWKFAALEYQIKVVEKAKREGTLCPEWRWPDIRTHFLLHSKDPRIARCNTVAQLQTMRFAVESRLIRNEGGERELDKGAAEMMLKIIKAESQERSLLAGNNSSSVSGKGKNPPGKSTVGDE